MTTTVQPYSVLLTYPDYLTGGDLETYYTHVAATDVASAIRAAQADCMAANLDADGGESRIEDADDLLVLLVIDGHPRDRHFEAEPQLEAPCQFCQAQVPAATAHLHQGAYVGDACCWDERLRASE